MHSMVLRRCIVSLSLALAACSTSTSFVVLRDVPEEPTITVLPFNYFHDQIAYANTTEEALLQLGVKVLHYQRQAKSVTTKEGAALDVGTEKAEVVESVAERLSTGQATEAITIETYIEYAAIKASYVIYCDFWSERLKVVKTDSLEVLASFVVAPSNLLWVLHDSLKALGFRVRDLPKPRWARRAQPSVPEDNSDK